MTELHVYYDNNSEWIIAESAEEAREIFLKTYDLSKDEFNDDDCIFTICDDEKEMIVNFEDYPEGLTDEEFDEWIDNNSGWTPIKKTNKEWVKYFGKGFLASSECY